MFAFKENRKPSVIPLVIWFLEVIAILVLCCVVIGLSLIPWPPTYTILSPGHFNHHSSTKVSVKTSFNHTVIFLLVITNPNEGKDIIHGDTTVTLYKDGLLLGVQTIQGFYQGQNSNHSSRVLVADQYKLRQGDHIDRNGTLEVGLETRVRYRILRWTTKQHLLNLEASVPISTTGTLLLGEEGVKLQPAQMSWNSLSISSLCFS